MTIRSITIAASSFIAPNNKAWNILSKFGELIFHDYGKINESLLTAGEDTVLVNIICINDFINNSDINENNINEIFDIYRNLIEKRISSNPNPLLIAVSHKSIINIVQNATIKDPIQLIYENLLLKLYNLSTQYKNLFIIDLNKSSHSSATNIFDNRNWYFAHSRYSAVGFKIIGQSIYQIINRYFFPPSKVLVLDCDNTLWGGVIGEDGLSKIKLGQDGIGQVFYDFQIEIKKIMNNGILIALASKNDEDDVWNVFENHNSMILKKEDITAFKINWNEKSKNIKEIADELCLGLDSFVFWDDNPMERDLIKNFLPEVQTINVPEDIMLWPDLIQSLDYFAKFSITDEDLKKTKQYSVRAKFISDKNKHTDQIAYLRSIKLRPKKILIHESNLSRAEQLCSKTNQFNLRTIRYSENDILSLSKNDQDFCFLTKLEDIYGDHGLISLVGLKKINSEIVFIDNLLMSCRVLGRNLEIWVLNEILKIAVAKNFEYIAGQYIETKKNKLTKSFFLDNNFFPVNESSDSYNALKSISSGENCKTYILKIDEFKNKNLDIFNDD